MTGHKPCGTPAAPERDGPSAADEDRHAALVAAGRRRYEHGTRTEYLALAIDGAGNVVRGLRRAVANPAAAARAVTAAEPGCSAAVVALRCARRVVGVTEHLAPGCTTPVPFDPLAVRVRITDTEALARLSPAALVRHAIDRGYRERSEPAAGSNDAPPWRDFDHPLGHELRLPAQVLGDYPARVGDALRVLADNHGVSELALYAEIAAF